MTNCPESFTTPYMSDREGCIECQYSGDRCPNLHKPVPVSDIVGLWAEKLVADCQGYAEDMRAAETEHIFNLASARIEGYYKIGHRILDDYDKLQRSTTYGQKIAQQIARSCGIKERMINYAVCVAREYPTWEELQSKACPKEGKALTWTKIIREIEGDNGKPECQHTETENRVYCVKCGKRIN